MERAWEAIKSLGGALLVLECVIWLMGSAHAGHAITNSREFGRALDQIAGAMVGEVKQGAHWLGVKRR
jgi:hypothetical protein